jgi:DNA modification methylase
MGFDYYGWELDPEYFEVGNKRFQMQTSQTNLFT